VKQTKEHIAERLRTWFDNGKSGMEKLCANEDVPEEVKIYASQWYEKGQARIDCIIKAIEEL